MPECGWVSGVGAGGGVGFERGQQFLVHVPLLEDAENGFWAEAGAGQLAEDSGSLFLVFRLLQALATQELASELFLVHFAVNASDRLLAYIAMTALGLH